MAPKLEMCSGLSTQPGRVTPIEYADRPRAFAWSIALIGLRDVRDYRITTNGGDRLHTASPFNVLAESPTLPGFTREEVGSSMLNTRPKRGKSSRPKPSSMHSS